MNKLFEYRSVVVYFVTSDGVKSWVMCTSEKKAREYVQNHPEIEEYAITYTEGVSEQITNEFKILKNEVRQIKETVNNAFGRW